MINNDEELAEVEELIGELGRTVSRNDEVAVTAAVCAMMNRIEWHDWTEWAPSHNWSLSPESLERVRPDVAARLKRLMEAAIAYLASESRDARSVRLAVERYFGFGYSKSRPPNEWVRVLTKLGDEMSLRTFKRRRDDGTYNVHPESTSRNIRLRLDTLPEGYSDSL